MDDFDFEPPSFSLGLDLDLDSGPRPHPSPPRAAFPSTTANLEPVVEEDDDLELPATVPDPEPPRTHKRLRRGPKAEVQKVKPKGDTWCNNVDDEIEDFSSEEDKPPGDPPTHSVCSSSKFIFCRPGILRSHCASEVKSEKKEGSSASASNVEMRSSKSIFPKLTVSPLRRFQLIDSDSDDPSASEDVSKEAYHSISPLKRSQSNHKQHAAPIEQRATEASVDKYQTEDLWEDFRTEKSFHIPTPAFDEVCKEYFGSVQDKSAAQNNCKGSNQIFDKTNGQQQDTSLPPAHRYFSHEDPRVRKLVRDRLPHFMPLGAGNSQSLMPHDASVIDYMGQFSHGETSKKMAKSRSAGTSSIRTRENKSGSIVSEILRESENWVNPKSCAGIPKDCGKRRIHAVSKSAGWFTNADGQRVYVNKNGQELRGQVAYRQYRKESGMGFNTSKRKSTAKKTTTKNSARNKKYLVVVS